MKRLLISLGVLVLLGAGCLGANQTSDYVNPFENGSTYTNTEFGFAFDYPPDYEAKPRLEETRPYQYLGLDVDFFLSFRDMIREEKPTTIFAMYAVPDLSTDAFVEALEATGEEVTVTSTEDVQINDLAMKKIQSTTAIGTDKIHYLFDRDGTTIIVSVFIGEQEALEPILQTFRSAEKK